MYKLFHKHTCIGGASLCSVPLPLFALEGAGHETRWELLRLHYIGVRSEGGGAAGPLLKMGWEYSITITSEFVATLASYISVLAYY